MLETIINEKLKEEEMIRKERNDHKRNQKRLQQKKMVCLNYSLHSYFYRAVQ